MLSMARALYVGRFQPPHWGHVNVVKWVLEKFDEVVVVVGSAQKSHTFDNPFTAGERILMLREALREAGVDLGRVLIIPVDDVENNYIWPRHVLQRTPPVDAVVTNNPLVARLFSEYGIKVVEPPTFNREVLRSTYIRRLMLEGSGWERFVPRSVAEIIRSIGGVDRLRTVTYTD